jgi:hypothetical protein
MKLSSPPVPAREAAQPNDLSEHRRLRDRHHLGRRGLIGTVGIMTGFKEDIQAKILGTTAHIIVQDRTKDGMTDYDATAKQTETVPNVLR